MKSKKFKDLKPESIEALRPHVEFWSTGALELEHAINSKLPIETTGVYRYIADYALTYAVLLDNTRLIEDLCQNGACLNVVDSWTRKTALNLAIDYGRAEAVKILLKYGAQISPETKVPSSNPCLHPLTFMWTLQELANNREANYGAVNHILRTNKMKRN